jgi:hypothetical protein
VAIVSARDFALVVHYNKMPNGTIYILAFDAGKPGLIPENKGIVRASVAVSGLIISLLFRSVAGNWNLSVLTKQCALTLPKSTSREAFQDGSLSRRSKTRAIKLSN